MSFFRKSRIFQQHALADKAAALSADVRVLRAILDECYAFADTMAERPPSRPYVI